MHRLFYAQGSSSLAAHIALEEAGIEFDVQRIDEDAGEHRRPPYLAINPRGKVPALRLPDGSVLVENIAIQFYAARSNPAAALLPPDPAGEAQVLAIMALFATAVHPAFSHFFAPQRFTGDPVGETGVRERGLATFHEHCRDIDARLAGRVWLFDTYTLADGYAFVFYGWGLRAGLPMEALVHYTAHRARMMARPAVCRVLSREA
ncbi:glutathione S-transferase family protein [Neoroseomonas lacus]|uniref:Glutathione S-transferase n=1 Tax=Neoroseomonas lacus TaxID=287609 RepID=A0A917NHJ0_9PROT|nr:glutathione S-transferase N-terminal domain-containing protein [Neoroseomonas lacus]GGJ01086.1 glutathione S-transferase [Neoroseomonas lacus]